MRYVLYILILLGAVSVGHGQESGNSNQFGLPVQQSSIAVNGVDIYFKIIGDGPPILLLHGFSGTGSWWDSLIEELAEENTLIIPDLPAHGRSSAHEGSYEYRQVAQDLFDVLDRLDLRQFAAIGYSAGGQILLHMATQQPTRIESMVLISSIHRIPDDIRKVLSEWPSLEDNPPVVQEYWHRNHPGGEKQIRALIDAMRSLAEYNGNVEFTVADLSEIRARTLLILGDRDGFVPLDLATEMYNSIPEASLWIVPSQGHSVIWPDWGGSPDARGIFPTVARQFLNGSK